MLFELYYVSFGQAIASFIISFAGIVVPFAGLPSFWRVWMYWLTPFHYLLEGFLAVAVHELPVFCAETEFARFAPPQGVACEVYTREFVAQVGGYVQTGVDGLCEFCQYRSGDEFVC